MNYKRVYRLYVWEKVSLRRKPGRKRRDVRQPLPEPVAANQVWSVDFMTDALSSGRKFRTSNIVDDYRRLPGVLEELKAERGLPRQVRSDNGTEFVSRAVDQWAYERGYTCTRSPGTPDGERGRRELQRALPRRVPERELVRRLADAREKITQWKQDYNEERPHSSLQYRTPVESAAQSARASPERERGKRPQTPAACPTPPSPLPRARGANKSRRKSIILGQKRRRRSPPVNQ